MQKATAVLLLFNRQAFWVILSQNRSCSFLYGSHYSHGIDRGEADHLLEQQGKLWQRGDPRGHVAPNRLRLLAALHDFQVLQRDCEQIKATRTVCRELNFGKVFPTEHVTHY